MSKLNSMVSTQEGKYTERRFILPAFVVLASTGYLFVYEAGLVAYAAIALPAMGMYLGSGYGDRYLANQGDDQKPRQVPLFREGKDNGYVTSEF